MHIILLYNRKKEPRAQLLIVDPDLSESESTFLRKKVFLCLKALC